MAPTGDAKAQSKEDHIPTTNEKPEEANDQGTGGLLSSIGDPVGKALQKGLTPVSATLGKGVLEPLGNGLGGTTKPALGPFLGAQKEKSELLGGDNTDSYESRPEKIAGKEQTGGNPLGLDQTGRWGFADDKQ